MQLTVSTEVSNSTNSTRDKILNAAKILFVDKGFSGTSMGQIASMAGVNHSLLFHHFGNKQNLWQETKQSIIEEGKSVYEILPSLNNPLSSYLKELIERAVIFYRKNTNITRLINWQRLESGTEKTAGLDIAEESKSWILACYHYQEKGEINKNLKPEYIITMIFAIVNSIALDPNNYIQNPDDNKAYIDFCVSSLLKSLRPDA